MVKKIHLQILILSIKNNVKSKRVLFDSNKQLNYIPQVSSSPPPKKKTTFCDQRKVVDQMLPTTPFCAIIFQNLP